MSRRCHDCGATGLEAVFPAARKPYGRTDRCADCTARPLSVSQRHVATRRAQLAALLTGGGYRAAKPFHTMPLFAGLRTGGND